MRVVRVLRVPGVVLLAGVLLAGCSGDAAESSSEVVELSAVPGDHIVQGPVYLAEDEGFYTDAGLEYKLEYPGSTVRAIQSLVGGEVGVAWTDGFGVLSAKSQGFDLVSLYSTYQGSGFAMAVAEDSSITTWDKASLDGTTIGVTAFDGGEVPILRAALARLGLTKEGKDFTLKAIGEGGPETAEAVENGTVDVVSASVLDLIALEDRGVKIRRITPDYLATAFPGHVYAVTPEQLEQDRDKIVSFLQAHAKSLVWLKENPLCVAEIAMKRAPETVGDLDKQGIADFLTTFWIDQNSQYFDKTSPNFHRIGAQNTQGWADYQDFLIKAGVEGDDGAVLDKPVTIDDIVSDDLIDDINDFDYDAVATEANAKTC